MFACVLMGQETPDRAWGKPRAGCACACAVAAALCHLQVLWWGFSYLVVAGNGACGQPALDGLPAAAQAPSRALPLCKATCGAEAGTTAALPLQTSTCHPLSGKMKWLMSKLGGRRRMYPGLGCWQPCFSKPSHLRRQMREARCFLLVWMVWGWLAQGWWVCGCSLCDLPLLRSHLSPQGWWRRWLGDSPAPPSHCGMSGAGLSPSSCPHGGGVGHLLRPSMAGRRDFGAGLAQGGQALLLGPSARCPAPHCSCTPRLIPSLARVCQESAGPRLGLLLVFLLKMH